MERSGQPDQGITRALRIQPRDRDEVTIPDYRSPVSYDAGDRDAGNGEDSLFFYEDDRLNDAVRERINDTLASLQGTARERGMLRYFFESGGLFNGTVNILDTPDLYADDERDLDSARTRIWRQGHDTLPLSKRGEIIESVRSFTRKHLTPILLVVGTAIGVSFGAVIGDRIGRSYYEERAKNTLETIAPSQSPAFASNSFIVEPIIEPIVEPIRE